MSHVERRAFPRHSVLLNASIAVRIGDESNVVVRIPAQVHSISRNGARLQVPEWATSYFKPGKITLIRIEHPSRQETELRCRVVWVKESEFAVTFVGRPHIAALKTSRPAAWTNLSIFPMNPSRSHLIS